MANSAVAAKLRSFLWTINPRRSLVAGAMWLIIALAVTFSFAAAVWVGGIAREYVVEQNARRLSLETDQLSSDLGQALSTRLDAVRAAGPILRAANALGRPIGLGGVFDELVSAYPQLDWIAIADSDGFVVRSNGALPPGDNIKASPWFSSGIHGPWLGVMGETSRLQTLGAANTTQIGDMAIPVRGEGGRIVGVIAAHVSWRRAAHHPERLTDESGPPAATETYVLNRDGVVLIGPDEVRQKLWNGIAINSGRRVASAGSFQKATNAPQFERLPNGKHVRVSRSQLSAGNEIGALGWQVQLSEPNERVYQRANALAFRILWVSMCLGVATALLGTMGARHLTGRLKRLALSVVSVGQSEGASIEFPRGVDEVAQLGAAFATILGSEALLRMAQEALRNVERHSKATRVAVRLRSTNDGRLELRVEDNGIGFDPGALRPGHYGIVGLREQAELIGADLRIDSKPNEGTTLCVSMRLSPITFNQTDKTIPP